MLSKTRAQGFTLLELVLSMGLLIVIVGITIPVYRTVQSQNDLSSAASVLAQSVRRAQILAASSEGDATWGVALADGGITVFQGATYAGRDTDYDEYYDLGTIQPTGLTEFVFESINGLPSSSGTVTLTSTDGLSLAVEINAYGMALY